MSIQLKKVDEDPASAEMPTEDAPASEDQQEAGASASEGIRPEFKQAMDSYEAFFDEYIEFMQSYQQGGNGLEMLSEYTDYMNQYAETMEKMDALGEEDMSNEELLYYNEVTSRISQKLLAVALETE